MQSHRVRLLQRYDLILCHLLSKQMFSRLGGNARRKAPFFWEIWSLFFLLWNIATLNWQKGTSTRAVSVGKRTTLKSFPALCYLGQQPLWCLILLGEYFADMYFYILHSLFYKLSGNWSAVQILSTFSSWQIKITENNVYILRLGNAGHSYITWK